jgi:hypothetical protein
MLVFAVIGSGARNYAWWTITGGLLAWAASYVLARSGDRGVAAGVAMSAGVGVAVAMAVVLTRWIGGHWLLW